MKSGHSVFAKYREASEVIDLHKLFNDYWTSNNHEFTVLSQSLSPTNPHISNRNKTTEAVVIGKHSGSLQLRFSANDTVRMFVISHPRQLTMSAKAEALRSSLHELEGLLKEYTPLMSSSVERHVDKAIKYGAVFAEVSSPTFTKKMSRS